MPWKSLSSKTDTSTGEHKLTLRAISRAYGVPFESLRRRIKGSITKAHQHQLGKKTVLPVSCEKELAEHIKNLASAGFPCTRDDIRKLAYEYAVRVGIKGFSEKKGTAGYYWFNGFMQRFPELSVKSAENLSVPRAMSMNRTQVSQWFAMYEAILNRLDIRDCPTHIWNFDETGCQNIHDSRCKTSHRTSWYSNVQSYSTGKGRDFYCTYRIECPWHGCTANDHSQR